MHRTKNLKNDNALANDFHSFRRSLQSQDLFIILGSQGSGTNLLCRILREIFKFSIVQDRSLIIDSAVKIHRKPVKSRIRSEINHVYRSFFPGSIRKRFNLKHYYHQAANYVGIEKYLDNSGITNAREFINFFYDYHAFMVGGKYRAIKSDDISTYFGQLDDDFFPPQKHILLVRDPRDNALSIVNKNFGPCVLYCASLYVKEKLLLHEREMQKKPKSGLVTHYETLLQNPKEFVENFSKQFNIEPVGDLSELDIRKGNFNKWMRLSEHDLEICETVLKDEILRFGYELKTNGNFKFSQKDLLLWRSTNFAKRITQRVNAQFGNLLNP